MTSWSSDKPAEVQRSNTTNGTTVTESYLYTYITSGTNAGLVSNVTLRRQVNGGTWANGSSNGYDNLNQFVAFARGTLNANHDTISSPSHSITWSLDALGNFSSTTTDGGSAVNNTFNKQNEETATGSANLTFDNNGNTTTDDNGKSLVCDAWNRLVAPLERLVVEQVVISWLQASHGHTTCAQLLSAEPTSAHLALVQKRQESSQRRLLLAAKQLAIIRKLLKPPLSLVGLAMRPVPETPGRPTNKSNTVATHNPAKPPTRPNRTATQRNGVLVPN